MERTGIVSLLVLLSLALPSCCVKEDRTVCPCRLIVDLSGCGDRDKALTIRACAESEFFSRTARPMDYPDGLEEKIPKGMVLLTAMSSGSSETVTGNRIHVRQGCMPDSIYTYSHSFEALVETIRDTVLMHKQFATVYLTMDNVGNEITDYPYRLLVRTDCNGLDAGSVEAIGGPLDFEPEQVGDRSFTFRLLRQRGEGIQLELLDRSRPGSVPVEVINIGRSILETGYDWNAEDLQDIRIAIGYAQTGISVEVRSWESGEGITQDF